MARSNKGQHKIPRTYLENFTDPKGFVWIANRNFDLFSQKPSRTLIEKDYYTIKFKNGTRTLNVETKFLGGIETIYSIIYKNKLEKLLPIDIEEKAKLSIFIASLLERQPSMRDSLEKFFSDAKEMIEHMRSLPDEAKKRMAAMPSFPSDRSQSIPAEELLEMGKDIGSLHSSMIPETVKDIAPIIFDMKWLFIIRPYDAYSFITSDHPCVMVDPVAEAKIGKGEWGSVGGLGYMDTELTLPLSSNLALMCRWEATKDCAYGKLPAEMVQEINKRTTRGAKVLIASDKEMLYKIISSIKLKQTFKN